MKGLVAVAILLHLYAFHCQDLDSITQCDGCLKLTPHIKHGNGTLAREISAIDSKHFLGVKSHTGFITVNEENGCHLFFWFFPAKTALRVTPWIIWLQGGPGFSSLLGLFDMMGPLEILDGEVKLRNVTWISDYSVLFIDNPVGAGFSFTTREEGYPDNEDDAGEQLLGFLQQFLEMFPELRQAPLFLAGESYAGKYVPALGMRIHKHNEGGQAINLRGLVIGSGMIDPRSIMHYSELCSSLGLLDHRQVEVVRKLEHMAVELIDEGRMVDAANKFNETIEYIKNHSRVSVYNFARDPSTAPPNFEAFLNRPDIRKIIGVGNVTFHFNNQHVYYKMLPDIMRTTKPLVEKLLEHYGVLCWHGQLDIIMAYSLAMNTYRSLDWSRRHEYTTASRELVTVHGKIVGYKKQGGNFIEVLVRNAGHMLPADQPEVAFLLLKDFVNKYK